jgi:hypothetical protein
MGTLKMVRPAKESGVGSRYLALVREGLSKDEAARRALAEVAARKRRATS